MKIGRYLYSLAFQSMYVHIYPNLSIRYWKHFSYNYRYLTPIYEWHREIREVRYLRTFVLIRAWLDYRYYFIPSCTKKMCMLILQSLSERIHLTDPSELLRPELTFVKKEVGKFRDYSVDENDPIKERVRQTYRQMHLNMTVSFVQGMLGTQEGRILE